MPRSTSRDAQLEHHDRDQDGDHAIAESLEPSLRHSRTLSEGSEALLVRGNVSPGIAARGMGRWYRAEVRGFRGRSTAASWPGATLSASSPSYNVGSALRSFNASSRSPRTMPNTAWRIVAWPKARRLPASFGSCLRAG